ncbi:MAG: HAD family hydrolase [Deltaproteobacteria bacterium]|nr:HAD family hydrolase [Deltaproteobacteria bacterium]
MKKQQSIAEIQEILNRTDKSKLPEIHISVLRNIMIEPIIPYLRYYALDMGFNAHVVCGEYDNVYQEAVGGNEVLFNKNAECIIVFMKLDTLSWGLSRNFNQYNQEQIQGEVARVQDYIKSVLMGIRKQTDAMILWHSFETPTNPSLGIWDSQTEDGQLNIVGVLNSFLRKILKDTSNAYFVDLNLCLARVGIAGFYDSRYWHIGRAPYAREGLREIALEDFKFIRPLKGKNKKCLALDCDNTLWGGIIGEDGLEGIKLGKTHPGSPYYEFQQEIVNLYHRGVIIAMCSKNNEHDVWEVFRRHPYMVLKEEHIATAQINWNDKAANLRQIALDLNIGIDSIVFMDDSEFEINLVREMLPEVKAIHLPHNRAVEYRDILSRCGLFDTLTVSEEDKNRGVMYKAESVRKKLLTEATDMISYYKSLEMLLEIRFANEFSIPRIAQQTQKTNQFNLTTRRYNEADIREFTINSDSDVISLKLIDRFGDSGIVGTCILRYEDKKAIIDTLLLSCRVLGRGVEDAFIIQALKLAKKRGCESVIGEYYATRKNAQVESFYSKYGFQELSDGNNKADKSFIYDLMKGAGTEPDFFKQIDSEI